MSPPADDVNDELRDGVPDEAAEMGTRGSSRRIQPGAELGGRFDVERKLGEGGMGQVFSAFDRSTRTQVAIKTLGPLTTDSIVQIKREFRTAAELVHPNLVRLHELFSDGFEWFFTMDLVDGDTLTKLVEQPNEVDYDLLRRIFWQLALGLTELHRAGAIHGDLKPSNFLIAGPERRVVLLDFGLSRPIGPAQDHQFAGTPAYMAPEQMLGQALSEAADWYAFGVVLYEALTGELPLRRPSAARLERAPADLGSLCLKLLKLSPADRPRGSEVLALMGSSPIGERFSAATPPPSRRSMIGRNDELSQLEAALAKSVDAPAMVLIEGPSGIGKTSLVERFVPHAYAQSAWVLVGRCRERESMGYKAVDGLIDDLVALLNELPEAEAASLLPENIIDLTVLFPALRGARAIAQAHGQGLEIPDHGVARQRAVAAFCELFANMRARAPVVIWIDDLQWSDGESALLIGRLLGGPDRVPVLMIGTYRSDPSGRGPLLEALLSDRTLLLPRPVEIELGPLSPMDAERLALDLLPSDEPRTAAIARDIGRDAGGNPLFIAELAYSAVQSNTERGLGAPGSPVTLSDLVKKRIAMLPPSAQRLLEAAAVAGAPLPRSVLARTQKMDPVETQASLDLLRANRLARTKGLGEADAVDIHHDRVREIVIQGLNDDQRRTHHLGLARVLEARLDTKPDVLASHYEGGGERALAGRYWLEGAHIAFQALAFEHAADLYAKGTSLALLDAPERRELHVRRAEALAYAGKGPAAADVYLAIAAESEPTAALELRRRAAEQLLLSGHLDRGLPVIEQVLTATGIHGTQSGLRAFLSLILGRLKVRARGLRHEARREQDLSSEELARVDASWTVACSLSVVDFVRGAEFQNKHLLLALRAGEPRRVLRALTLEVGYAATPGRGSERRTAHVLAIADRLAQGSTDDAAAKGLLSLSRGIAAYLHERLEDALTHFEAAIVILTTRCSGAIWETFTAQRFLVATLFFLGRLGRLSAIVPKLLSEAEGKGNIYATMCFRCAYSCAAWLVHDSLHEARRQLERAREEWTTSGYQLSHSNLLIGETFLDFYTGDAYRPHARICEQWPKLLDSQLLRIAIFRVQLRQLRGASALLAARAHDDRGERTTARELRREARKYAGLLRRERSRRAAPWAALIDAGLDDAEGNHERARHHLAAAVAAFDAQGLRLFSAAARVRLGELTTGVGGEVLASGGYEDFRREGIVDPKRMVALLAPGFR